MRRRGGQTGGRRDDARSAAHRVLADVRSGSYADRASELRLSDLHDRERALALELAYGVMRLRARLDTELERLVDRPLARLDPALLDWLRLGLYQLREMRIPGHAAVHETVQGVRAGRSRGAAGLANAVLRRADREGVPDDLFPDPDADPVGWLSAWGSHPEWLVRRWLDRWPLADVERLVENDNRPPRVTFRLLGDDDPDRPLVDPETGVALERMDGWPRMVRLVSGRPSEVLAKTRAIVQDPAASSVVDFVGGAVDGPVLDACAAPGGKAAALSDLARSARPFVAADADRRRIVRVVETLERTGSDARVAVMDARRPAIQLARTVLLDAPCSGTGVLRRRPDARWRISPRRLASLLTLQAKMLDAVADVLETGGLLVYATCSLEAEENEGQVEAFLARRPEFTREAPGPLAGVAAECVTERGDLEILPFRTGTDGAYASRLRKGGTG